MEAFSRGMATPTIGVPPKVWLPPELEPKLGLPLLGELLPGEEVPAVLLFPFPAEEEPSEELELLPSEDVVLLDEDVGDELKRPEGLCWILPNPVPCGVPPRTLLPAVPGLESG